MRYAPYVQSSSGTVNSKSLEEWPVETIRSRTGLPGRESIVRFLANPPPAVGTSCRFRGFIR